MILSEHGVVTAIHQLKEVTEDARIVCKSVYVPCVCDGCGQNLKNRMPIVTHSDFMRPCRTNDGPCWACEEASRLLSSPVSSPGMYVEAVMEDGKVIRRQVLGFAANASCICGQYKELKGWSHSCVEQATNKIAIVRKRGVALAAALNSGTTAKNSGVTAPSSVELQRQRDSEGKLPSCPCGQFLLGHKCKAEGDSKSSTFGVAHSILAGIIMGPASFILFTTHNYRILAIVWILVLLAFYRLFGSSRVKERRLREGHETYDVADANLPYRIGQWNADIEDGAIAAYNHVQDIKGLRIRMMNGDDVARKAMKDAGLIQT